MKLLFSDKRKNIINSVFSLIFSACTVSGWQLENKGYVDFSSPVKWIIWILLSCAVFFLMTLADTFIRRKNAASEKREFPSKRFFAGWAGLFVCYIPALLASWPGFFCYDAETESYEVFTFKYSNHHPIVHELFLGNSLRLGNRLFGSYNAGITIFVVIQMIIISAICSLLLATLYRYGMSKVRYAVSFIFLAFFPTIQMFVVCTAKDVLFIGGLILFLTALIRAIHRDTSYAMLFISVCMMLFFRNNGIYILPLFCILLFFMEKNSRKLLLPVIAGIVVYLAVSEALIAFLPAKRGETSEMLSVPMQQLARVHSLSRETYTDEDLEILYTLIPEVILENYNPKLADNIKVNFLEDNFKADTSKYASLWARTFLKKPGIYLDAWGMMSDGYWYISAPITGYKGRIIGGVENSDSSYFQYTLDNPGIADPKLKSLNAFYKSLSFDMFWQKVPVISLILLPSTYIWIFLWEYAKALKEKRNRSRMLFWVPGLLFMTMLLGPIALVRYALPFYMMIPVYLAPEALKGVQQQEDKD